MATKYEVRDSSGYVHFIMADRFTVVPGADASNLAYKFFRTGGGGSDMLVASFTSPVSVKEVATYVEPEHHKATWTKVEFTVRGFPGDVRRLITGFGQQHGYQLADLKTEAEYR